MFVFFCRFFCSHTIKIIFPKKKYYHGTELNNLCWVTEISQRQVAFVAIMRPPRPNLKIKHEINYGIESFYSRGAGKLKLCLVQICYIITLKTNIM